MSEPHKHIHGSPVRVMWNDYEDGDWQIEFVVPQEVGTALLMDKAFEPMMRQLKR